MNSSNLEDSATKLNNFSFESGWSGSAFELQNGLLNENVASYMKCISDIKYYQQILEKREEYSAICDQIVALYREMDECAASHEVEGHTCICADTAQKILDLEKQRQDLRTKIVMLLSIFTDINPEIFIPDSDLRAEASKLVYLFDLNDLIDIYASGKLNPTPDGFGLFDMYNQYDENGNLIPYSGENYVNEQIEWVISQCRNEREIAVNISLLYAKLAADKGYSLTYENPGAQGGVDGWRVPVSGTTMYSYHENDIHKFNPNIMYDTNYNNVTQVQEGMDCCAWVSYTLNVATAKDPTVPNPQGFAYQGVNGLNGFGEQIAPSESQPGDIFIAPSPGNPQGHTGVIVSVEPNSSDPSKGTIVVCESGGLKSNYSVNEYTYWTSPSGSVTMHKGGTTFRNMDSVYSGEQVSVR